jgi:hypothetical protein
MPRNISLQPVVARAGSYPVSSHSRGPH